MYCVTLKIRAYLFLFSICPLNLIRGDSNPRPAAPQLPAHVEGGRADQHDRKHVRDQQDEHVVAESEKMWVDCSISKNIKLPGLINILLSASLSAKVLVSFVNFWMEAR